MTIEPFVPGNVQGIDLPGFADRMAAMRARGRPKREGRGAEAR